MRDGDDTTGRTRDDGPAQGDDAVPPGAGDRPAGEGAGPARAPGRGARPAGGATAPRDGARHERGDRRARLLDAAVRVIARDGLRGLTHRGVQQEAGLPHGSVTYYFGTREDLLAAISAYLVEQDRARVVHLVDELARALGQRDAAPPYDRLADGLLHWLHSARDLHIARSELMVAGIRDDVVREVMTRGSNEIAGLAEMIAAAAGAADPVAEGRMLVTAIDGLMFACLTQGRHDRDEVATALRRAIESIGR